jgi:hypothetical protein
MGVCKGNRGNLMQHWTLCEVLDRLQREQVSSLHFISTHSMAPWSLAKPKNNEESDADRRIFRRAGERLARNSGGTLYENAWLDLSVEDGIPYPSSALFAQSVWKKPISLALCEQATTVADEIDGWLKGPAVCDRYVHGVLLRGDWRAGIDSPFCMKTDCACVYIEMDPMRYDHRESGKRKQSDPASLYPEDLTHLTRLLTNEARPVVLQISSFSAQNGNSRQVIETSLRSGLEPSGFSFADQTYVNGQMVSFVFCRGIELQNVSLQTRFSDWISSI